MYCCNAAAFVICVFNDYLLTYLLTTRQSDSNTKQTYNGLPLSDSAVFYSYYYFYYPQEVKIHGVKN